MVCLRASEEALTSECALQLSFNYASHSYTTSWKVEHEEAVQSPFSIYQRQLINWKKLRSKKKSPLCRGCYFLQILLLIL